MLRVASTGLFLAAMLRASRRFLDPTQGGDAFVSVTRLSASAATARAKKWTTIGLQSANFGSS